MNEQNKTRRSYADITLRFCRHEDDSDPGVIYQRRKMIPVEYFSDTRYHGYVGFEFQEMYEQMVRALKETPS